MRLERRWTKVVVGSLHSAGSLPDIPQFPVFEIKQAVNEVLVLLHLHKITTSNLRRKQLGPKLGPDLADEPLPLGIEFLLPLLENLRTWGRNRLAESVNTQAMGLCPLVGDGKHAQNLLGSHGPHQVIDDSGQHSVLEPRGVGNLPELRNPGPVAHDVEEDLAAGRVLGHHAALGEGLGQWDDVDLAPGSIGRLQPIEGQNVYVHVVLGGYADLLDARDWPVLEIDKPKGLVGRPVEGVLLGPLDREDVDVAILLDLADGSIDDVLDDVWRHDDSLAGQRVLHLADEGEPEEMPVDNLVVANQRLQALQAGLGSVLRVDTAVRLVVGEVGHLVTRR